MIDGADPDPPSTEPDRALIACLARGEGAALDALMDRYQGELLEEALRRIGDFGVAEHIVQETFLAAAQGAARFRGGSSVRTWLRSIVHHKCVDELRRSTPTAESRLRARDRRRWEEAQQAASPPGRTPHAIVLARADYADLRTVVRTTLTPPYEKVLLLWAQRYSYGEIAQACGIPIGTVKSRLNYARTALADTLEHHGGES